MSGLTPDTDLAAPGGDGAGGYSARRLFLVAVLFIAAAPVFWLRTQIHPGSVEAAYENADLYQEIYPALHYGFGRLRAGELPLWNNRQLCGTPFLADPSSGIFQPLNAVFAILPTHQAMAVHGFVCLALMGAFFVLFARSLGTGYAAALIGGVAYAFCGAAAAAITRPAIAAGLTWMPLLCWGVRECGRRFQLVGAVLAGMAGALLVLSGANALTVCVLGLAVPYGVLIMVWPAGSEGPRLGRRIESMVLAAVLAVTLAAVQWAPALTWVWSLDRPWEAVWGMNAPGQAPTSFTELLAQLVMPRPGALPRVGYLGAITLLAIPAAFFHGKGRREACFFLAAGALLLAVSVGRAGRMPLGFPQAYFVFPGLFCVTVVSALGFDRLLQARRGAKPMRVWLPAAAVIAGACLLFYVSTAEPRGRIAVFVAAMIPMFVFRMPRLSAVCGIGLAFVLFADLCSASQNLYLHPFTNAPACYQRYAKTISAVEEQAFGARIVVSSAPLDFGLTDHLALLYPLLNDADGSGPLTRDQAVWWRRLGTPGESGNTSPRITPKAAAPRLWHFTAARVVVAAPNSPMASGLWDGEGPRLREQKTEDAARVYVNESALPRAIWAAAWREARDVDDAADLLSQSDFDGARECVIDRNSEGFDQIGAIVPGPRDGPESAPAPPINATCSVQDVSPERVVVEVSAPQPGIIVLADCFDTDWQATIDGRSCPILRANGIFRGVATPAGAHEIVFEYRPASFNAGLAVSLATAALLMLVSFVAFVRG